MSAASLGWADGNPEALCNAKAILCVTLKAREGRRSAGETLFHPVFRVADCSATEHL